MALLDPVTPNFGLLKSGRNWALVALVLFLTGVVFHLVATHMGATSTPTPTQPEQ